MYLVYDLEIKFNNPSGRDQTRLIVDVKQEDECEEKGLN